MIQKNSVDTVSISVPPMESMSKVVRLATTAVASRIGLNIDQADDLNTALDELFRSCLAQHAGDKINFDVSYFIHPDHLEIVARGCVFADEKEKVGRYSRFLMESLADRVQEIPNPHGGLDVVIVKQLVTH